MSIFTIIFIPLVSGLIGWITNFVAIKMLFHPRRPVNVLGYQLQGVFPKRKAHLARNLGRIIANDLFSTDMLVDQFDTPETREELRRAISERIINYIHNFVQQLHPMAAMLLAGQASDKLEAKIQEAIDGMLPEMMDKVRERVAQVDIANIVETKLLNFSDQQFENLLMSVMKKELTFVEITGGVLGFLIGVFQLLFIYMGA